MTPDTAIGYAVGSEYTYECNTGFVYDGDSAELTVTCAANGTWSATRNCVGKIYIYLSYTLYIWVIARCGSCGSTLCYIMFSTYFFIFICKE